MKLVSFQSFHKKVVILELSGSELDCGLNFLLFYWHFASSCTSITEKRSQQINNDYRYKRNNTMSLGECTLWVKRHNELKLSLEKQLGFAGSYYLSSQLVLVWIKKYTIISFTYILFLSWSASMNIWNCIRVSQIYVHWAQHSYHPICS